MPQEASCRYCIRARTAHAVGDPCLAPHASALPANPAAFTEDIEAVRLLRTPGFAEVLGG